MYRNTESPYSITGTNIVFSVNYISKTNKQLRKEIRFVFTRGRRWEEGEFHEGPQKIQTSIYRTNKGI